jgi:hypothetical protein
MKKGKMKGNVKGGKMVKSQSGYGTTSGEMKPVAKTKKGKK